MFGHIAILFSILSLAYCCSSSEERRLALTNVHEIRLETGSAHQYSRNCRLYSWLCDGRHLGASEAASEANFTPDSKISDEYIDDNDEDKDEEIPKLIRIASQTNQRRRITRKPTTKRQQARGTTKGTKKTTKQTGRRVTTKTTTKTSKATTQRSAEERVVIADNDSASFRLRNQPVSPEKAMENVRRAVHQALNNVLKDMGLSSTVNFTIHNYEPDKVTINTIISGSSRRSRRKGGFIVRNGVVIARVNGKEYNKTLSVKVNNIGVSIPTQFWIQCGRSFATYLKQYSRAIIYKMFVGPDNFEF
uniref:Uncharacterized protein n=1 Tax=Setaria digitata TaxID=48799 RepID=A0A915Q314_9BILA